MALDDTLIDTYRRYKNGTKSFVQWLAQTARATGMVDDIFHDLLDAPRAGPRLKGKARKEAKKALRTIATTFPVPVKQYTRLATAIAASSKAEVPQAVFTTLHTVIQGRKECARWYQSVRNDDKDMSATDDDTSHQHFVNVLTKVYEILKPKQSESHQRCPVKDVSSSSRLANQFEHLTLEETVESDHIPPIIPITTDTTNICYESKDLENDEAFAIYCLIEALTRLRHFAKDTWQEYKEGKITLQTAAVTSNTACAMIEKASDSFVEDFPHYQREHGGKRDMHTKILDFVTRDRVARHISTRALAEGAQKTALDQFDLFLIISLRDSLCVHAAQLAAQVINGTCDPLRLTREERRFAKTISQLIALPLNVHYLFRGDMVHRALHEWVKTRSRDLWTVFVVQVLWDTQETLGASLRTGQQILSTKMRELDAEYNLFLNALNSKNLTKTQKSHRDKMQLRQDDIIQLIDSGDFQMLVNGLEASVIGRPIRCVDFVLLDHVPALCGLALMNLYHIQHTEAMDMAGQYGAILSVIHLHNAARAMNVISEDLNWGDLEWFTEQQEESWIYVGHPPRSVSDFGSRLDLALGRKYSHQMQLMRNGAGLPVPFKMKFQCRQFKYCAEFSERGVERNKQRERIGSSRAYEDPYVMANWIARGLPEEGACGEVPATKVLAHLKIVLEKDVDALCFSVQDLYLRCLGYLQQLGSDCAQMAPHDFPKDMYSLGMGNALLISDLLYLLNGSPCHHESMFPHAIDLLRRTIEDDRNSIAIGMQARHRGLYMQKMDNDSDDKERDSTRACHLFPFILRNYVAMGEEEKMDGYFTLKAEMKAEI